MQIDAGRSKTTAAAAPLKKTDITMESTPAPTEGDSMDCVRLRDAAEDFLEERHALWRLSSAASSNEQATPSKDGTGTESAATPQRSPSVGRSGSVVGSPSSVVQSPKYSEAIQLFFASQPPSSTTEAVPSTVPSTPTLQQYDDTAAKNLILPVPEYKEEIGRMAFDAAARVVLFALEQRSSHLSPKHSKKVSTQDAVILQKVLGDWEILRKRRIVSLDRSHNNKEYAKQFKAAKSTEGATAVMTPSDSAVKRSPSTVVSASSSPPMSSAVRGSTVEESNDDGAQAPYRIGSGAGATGDEEADDLSPAKVASTNPTKLSVTTNTADTETADSKGPKFTRNTPASSAAALDFRFNSSRAILCAAGNIVFEALTPSCDENGADKNEIDVLDVPQKHNTKSNVNMGAVVVEAQTLAQRTLAVVENALRRAHLRYQYRKENALFDIKDDVDDETDQFFTRIENPFAWKGDKHDIDLESMDSVDSSEESAGIPYDPKPESLSTQWVSRCRPRLLSILNSGAGHAIYHDMNWASRHGRIADLLRSMSTSRDSDPKNSRQLGVDSTSDNFGPHLIVTTEPEVYGFAQEFHDCLGSRQLVSKLCDLKKTLKVLAYQGTKKARKKLRLKFPEAKGLPESPFHVMVTSYTIFLEDYFHFCQMPFETVILDDGVSWMATAQGDPNSAIGSIWDNGIWSANDQQTGLAGTFPTGGGSSWDFSREKISETAVKDAWVGLTARHRIMTSATLALEQRSSVDLVPVSGLVNFVAPHFADVVREEWDRSRITSDLKSMDHFRQLVARSTVVHSSGLDMGTDSNSHQIAVRALNGEFECKDRSDPIIPHLVLDDAFVSNGKINFSRRSALAWLGPANQSWLRYELGKAKLQHILDAMKISNKHGHFCEEITTASSTTTSGATGQVAGTMAYRLAIRCGRHFGSEQGLRQHISALHAPPGTWLCRTCGSDCMTSQARTHHERSCGQPSSGVVAGETNSSVGAVPTVGQGATGKSGVGKKKGNRSSISQPATTSEEKDADGSFRVPGYRGVWVNKDGKHFVKIDGEKVNKDGNADEVLLFDACDDAAKKHDEVLCERKKAQKDAKLELNFKPDGTRIVYEDVTPASTSGLGGSASSVVPALSIINIKDLPPDVKPLLRDPRQTSRTGGNAKRHIYAYRGVCRQARKGHDRWQSQISFMGVNHYLGTFDSEWDAAAIYAWAHLILYGEEATKQAQKEGEEAAAAYEKEKQDIAAGRLPEPVPKQKKKPAKKKDKDGATPVKGEKQTRKRKSSTQDTPAKEKRAKTTTKACKLEKEAIGSTVAKGVTKAAILGPREIYDGLTDTVLMEMASARIEAARSKAYLVTDIRAGVCAAHDALRPCIPARPPRQYPPLGAAVLVGLNPSWFGWDIQDFVAAQGEGIDVMMTLQMLAVEYDDDGINERFHSVVQGSMTVLGRASDLTQKSYKSLGLGTVPLGGTIGNVDCHVGGLPGSCSEKAACIRYSPTGVSDFQMYCLSESDVVTVNGRKIDPSSGGVPLRPDDICSVACRVFSFVVNS